MIQTSWMIFQSATNYVPNVVQCCHASGLISMRVPKRSICDIGPVHIPICTYSVIYEIVSKIAAGADIHPHQFYLAVEQRTKLIYEIGFVGHHPYATVVSLDQGCRCRQPIKEPRISGHCHV